MRVKGRKGERGLGRKPLKRKEKRQTEDCTGDIKPERGKG